MKSEHTYTVNGKVHAVNFQSGNLQEWTRRLGESRVLYFLHSWAAAHSGQSWFKALVQKVGDKPNEDSSSDKAKDDWEKAMDKMADVRRGEYIDLIGLMPKERAEREWTEVLLEKVKKARAAGGNEEAKRVKDEYFAGIEESERATKIEEYTDFIMSLA